MAAKTIEKIYANFIAYNEKVMRETQKEIDIFAQHGYSEDYPRFAAMIDLNKNAARAIADAKWSLSLIK